MLERSGKNRGDQSLGGCLCNLLFEFGQGLLLRFQLLIRPILCKVQIWSNCSSSSPFISAPHLHTLTVDVGSPWPGPCWPLQPHLASLHGPASFSWLLPGSICVTFVPQNPSSAKKHISPKTPHAYQRNSSPAAWLMQGLPRRPHPLRDLPPQFFLQPLPAAHRLLRLHRVFLHFQKSPLCLAPFVFSKCHQLGLISTYKIHPSEVPANEASPWSPRDCLSHTHSCQRCPLLSVNPQHSLCGGCWFGDFVS